MKLLVLAFCIALPLSARAQMGDDRVNAVLGDRSFVEAFGRAPTAEDSEGVRIQTHLRHVVRRLRAATLPGPQAETRRHLLAVLARYAEQGVFPRRGDDGFAGRRPRFIDDRGVHCAVGHLIAKSGHASLAARIDRDEEYAYVEQMRTPGLRTWAKTHGFTLRELASIQPGYRAPPTEEETRASMQHVLPMLTLHCAKHGTPVAFRVRVRGTRSGAAAVSSRADDDPFVACMVERLANVERGGGAYDGPVRRYRFRMRVRPPSVQSLLETHLAGIDFEPDGHRCVPRPGAIPRRAFVRVDLGPADRHVRVGTEPRNEEVAQCLADYVHAALASFEGIRGTFRARRAVVLRPRVSDARLHQHLRYLGPEVATACVHELPEPVSEGPEPARPRSVLLRVVAHPDEDALRVEVEGGVPGFDACVVPRLRERMQEGLRVPRRRGDQTEPYLRLDAAGRAETRFQVETASQREARLEEERRRFEEAQAPPHI